MGSDRTQLRFGGLGLSSTSRQKCLNITTNYIVEKIEKLTHYFYAMYFQVEQYVVRELETLKAFFFLFFFFFSTRYLIVTLLALCFLGSLFLDPNQARLNISQRGYVSSISLFLNVQSQFQMQLNSMLINTIWYVGFCDTRKIVSLLHSEALFALCDWIHRLRLSVFLANVFCISSAP